MKDKNTTKKKWAKPTVQKLNINRGTKDGTGMGVEMALPMGMFNVGS